MSTLVYMKLLERTPARYDRGMRLLTLGRIDRIKREIARRWVDAGDTVLEIGCGTGTLAAMLLERGAHVVGIDISDAMLAVARANAPGAEILHMTATEIGALGERRFHRVVATLTLSELSSDELDHVLGLARGMLEPGGTVVLADEVRPPTRWQRALAACVRWPMAALTFLLTRSTSRALKGLEPRLARAGLRVLHHESFLLGTLALVVAEREG
ncbi:MAG: corrinoid protein-associated methyltransferase CpaM [Planctomycetota bacterium]